MPGTVCILVMLFISIKQSISILVLPVEENIAEGLQVEGVKPQKVQLHF